VNTDLIPITIIPRAAALVVPAARAEMAARDARRARLARGRPRQRALEARGDVSGGGVDGFHVEGSACVPGSWQERWLAIRAEKVARGEERAGVEALMRVREIFGEGVGRG
jgi:hypothetical protein